MLNERRNQTNKQSIHWATAFPLSPRTGQTHSLGCLISALLKAGTGSIQGGSDTRIYKKSGADTSCRHKDANCDTNSWRRSRQRKGDLSWPGPDPVSVLLSKQRACMLLKRSWPRYRWGIHWATSKTVSLSFLEVLQTNHLLSPQPCPATKAQALTQTESERSLLPTAQQQYGQLGFVELPFFCFFLKIFGLNF